jgi:hypothetical protein
MFALMLPMEPIQVSSQLQLPMFSRNSISYCDCPFTCFGPLDKATTNIGIPLILILSKEPKQVLPIGICVTVSGLFCPFDMQ